MAKRIANLVRKRTVPGILIFDDANRILFSNDAAADLLPFSCKEMTVDMSNRQETIQAISHLCDQVKSSSSASGDDPVRREIVHCTVLSTANNGTLALRAFPTYSNDKDHPVHIMVLVEKVAENRQVDFKTCGEEFELSRREIEVLELLYRGLGNKDIASRLFISEYTVKDHLKNIMRKMDCSTRNEIISSLK